MATNLFSKAAAYRKKHKGMTMPEAVKAVSKGAKKKPAARKKAAVKKHAVGKVKKAAVPRKIKIKVKPGKKGTSSVSISGISMGRLHSELTHKDNLVKKLEHFLDLKKSAVGSVAKSAVQRDIDICRKAIAASKKHITALKRTI